METEKVLNSRYLGYMTPDDHTNLPDVRDGLTRKQRIILYCLDQIQKERGGRNVPTPMLYGRVIEHIDMSMDELQAELNSFDSKGP